MFNKKRKTSLKHLEIELLQIADACIRYWSVLSGPDRHPVYLAMDVETVREAGYGSDAVISTLFRLNEVCVRCVIEKLELAMANYRSFPVVFTLRGDIPVKHQTTFEVTQATNGAQWIVKKMSDLNDPSYIRGALDAAIQQETEVIRAQRSGFLS